MPRDAMTQAPSNGRPSRRQPTITSSSSATFGTRPGYVPRRPCRAGTARVRYVAVAGRGRILGVIDHVDTLTDRQVVSVPLWTISEVPAAVGPSVGDIAVE